jgi:hypothetical protein
MRCTELLQDNACGIAPTEMKIGANVPKDSGKTAISITNLRDGVFILWGKHHSSYLK